MSGNRAQMVKNDPNSKPQLIGTQVFFSFLFLTEKNDQTRKATTPNLAHQKQEDYED